MHGAVASAKRREVHETFHAGFLHRCEHVAHERRLKIILLQRARPERRDDRIFSFARALERRRIARLATNDIEPFVLRRDRIRIARERGEAVPSREELRDEV